MRCPRHDTIGTRHVSTHVIAPVNEPLPGRMLVIDDEADIRQLVSLSLARIGIDVHAAANLAEARELLTVYRFDACLTDMRLPDGNGIDFVTEATARYPHMPVAVITAHGQLASAVDAMRNGAFDFVSKPVDLGVLRRLAVQALRVRTASEFIERSDDPFAPDSGRRDRPVARGREGSDRPTPGSAEGIPTLHRTMDPGRGTDTPSTIGPAALIDGDRLVGSAAVVLALRVRIDKVSRTNAPVWITGESGTGKELIARLIHANGPRATAPFVAINCGAIPSELMESEFFGHRKGAFTGAHQDKQGLFQAAEGGTLFLDEIAELPLHMQVKLLRAVQERSVRPIGESAELNVDVRILSASHAELAELVEAGRFRQDLYYRLNVISIRAPALRDRAEDIPALSRAILARLTGSTRAAALELTDGAMEKLAEHSFPGNVRELENVLERACALATGTRIDADDIELDIEPGPAVEPQAATVDADEASTRPGIRTDISREDRTGFATADERERIVSALEETRWNRRRAAERLGLTYRQLRYRITRLGLDDGDRAA